jgi:hypothetical protein
MPDGTGMTASQAWLTEPATVAFTWLDKSYGNEEYQTCCKIADTAIAVPGNVGEREASLASRKLRSESGGLSPALIPAVLDSAGKPGDCREHACAGELVHWESNSIQPSSALSEGICVPRNSIRNVDKYNFVSIHCDVMAPY